MGIFDKARDLAGRHSDQVGDGLDRAGEVVDERTGGRHSEHIDTGVDAAKDHLGLPDDEAAADEAAGRPTGGPAAEQRPGSA